MRTRKITIVSLSGGILGESFITHELEIGVRRLEEYGVSVQFSRYALEAEADAARQRISFHY